MKYDILKDCVGLLEEFEADNSKTKMHSNDLEGFKQWIVCNSSTEKKVYEPYWEGKENGRSPESVISTLLVHLNRYAKSYSKSAIFDSDFSTQDDFIYLINLKAFGEMTKMDLVKRNVHEKPAGMQIINRLISQGWVVQAKSDIDKRSKTICITPLGMAALDTQMDKIRQASQIVSGDLTHHDKIELIRLLTKLNDFHQPIYQKNIEPENLLKEVLKDH